MEKLKVVSVNSSEIEFENGVKLHSHHNESCCEEHYLSMEDLDLSDFDGLEFDLTNDNFFERIKGYGIALKPINGFAVRIPGYGQNNGYYNSDLALILTNNVDFEKTFDITECQDYEED